MFNRIVSATLAPLAFIFLSVPLANAQFPDASKVNELILVLDLSEEQEAAAKPILLKSMDDRMKIMESAGIVPGTKPKMHQMMKVRGPMQASQKETETQLSAILTPPQMNQYRTYVEQMRNEMRARMR